MTHLDVEHLLDEIARSDDVFTRFNKSMPTSEVPSKALHFRRVRSSSEGVSF